jgi:hypothetical protein
MHTVAEAAPVSKTALWTGRILSVITILFLLFDAFGKLTRPAFVVEACARLGYSGSVITGIGIILLVCTALYVIPRTSILGAILLTGFLGGAVASQVRIGEGPGPVLFPILFAALIWTGLWLRDVRTRTLLAARE